MPPARTHPLDRAPLPPHFGRYERRGTLPMSANTKPVTDSSFATDVLGAPGPVLVDFWAEWCGPCRAIGAEFADRLTIAKVNVDENPRTPNQYNVRGIPTLVLFKDGKPVATKVGAAPKSVLRDWIAAAI
jgi:thioredoxin 1